MYSDKLISKAKPAVMRKPPGFLSKGVTLLHDNARPHTAELPRATINKLVWEILPHPPYSPDLAPSDFHLVGPLKEVLRDTKFYDNHEAEENS